MPNVPSSLSFRSRSSNTCTGTGSLDLSYSEQYPHDKLQRRMTTIWVRNGLYRRRKKILGAAGEAAGEEVGADTDSLAITPSRDCSKMRLGGNSWDLRSKRVEFRTTAP